LDIPFVSYKFKEILNKKYIVNNIELDISLASYLITANTKEELESIIESEIGDSLKNYGEVFDKSDIHHCQIDQMGAFAIERVEAVYNMADSLKEKLQRENLDKLYYDIELPLLRVLSNMETTGIKINTGYFSKYAKELSKKIDNLIPLIYKESRESIKKNYELMEISEFNIIEKYQELGQLMYKKKSELYAFNKEFDNLTIEELLEYEMKFNIASPKQLGIIFFDLMKLPVVKKTKSGYSVNEEVLDFLKEKGYKIANYLLEYRKLTKLLSTYVDALPKLVDSDDRIHTTYNQSGTATGRLSSSDPNLQNIPSRTEEGIKIREGFIPKEGYSLLAFDYSQIELRVLAEMSNDKNLIDAYKNNLDLHDLTAKKLFELEEHEEITREQRAVAKIVNFSIIYGKTAFGLAKELGISNEEARLYIKRYFSQYPEVKILENQIISDAKEKGYVRTMFNRRRMIPEIKSSNKNIQQQGERMAVNTVIQGTAADILKIVMIKIFDFIKEKEDITMNLQVHDELLFEVKDESLDFYIEKIKEIMENTVKLKNVVLKTNVAYGKNWSEAK
jgi:DNA polymerase-1